MCSGIGDGWLIDQCCKQTSSLELQARIKSISVVSHTFVYRYMEVIRWNKIEL